MERKKARPTYMPRPSTLSIRTESMISRLHVWRRLSKGDNLPPAQVAQPIVPAIATLRATGRIPAVTLVDLCYRFAGELGTWRGVVGRVRGGRA